MNHTTVVLFRSTVRDYYQPKGKNTRRAVLCGTEAEPKIRLETETRGPRGALYHGGAAFTLAELEQILSDAKAELAKTASGPPINQQEQ